LFILLKGISTDIFVVDIFLRNFYLSIFLCNWAKLSIDNLWQTPTKGVSSNPVHGEM
jgi:hypothetical protein